jgi:A/G-specific adenine glycosylase
MLQQTRVDQAVPYYHRFLEAFPSIEALAEADLDAVLQAWEGLGYYSRARHLHRAARKVVREHQGQLPDGKEALEDLPGIGPYTSAAILSIAFDKPYAVVDGNVSRVLARTFRIDADITKYATKRLLRELADDLLARNNPEAFNQALMELGATICTPRSPRCEQCPIQPTCEAYRFNKQMAYPVKSSRKSIPHHNIAVGLIFNRQNELLIAKRPEDAMLGGLWEFPGGKQEEKEPLHETCARELQEELSITVTVGPLFYELDHAYSHFKISLHAFPCRITDGTPNATNGMPIRWASLDELSEYAFPRANRRIIEELENRKSHPDLFERLEAEDLGR